MKFFADTAEIADIKDLAATGLLDGVTTNPSLIAKSGRDFMEVTKEICGLTHGPGQEGLQRQRAPGRLDPPPGHRAADRRGVQLQLARQIGQRQRRQMPRTLVQKPRLPPHDRHRHVQ